MHRHANSGEFAMTVIVLLGIASAGLLWAANRCPLARAIRRQIDQVAAASR
jgi:hypothetical protein